MAEKRRRKERRAFPLVELAWVRNIMDLVRHWQNRTVTWKSDIVALQILQKVFGAEWVEEHVKSGRASFLKDTTESQMKAETNRFRRIALGEMLHNLSDLPGFQSCLRDLATGDKGQIESTYAVMDIARMMVTRAVDRAMTFRIVIPVGKKRRDYDLSIKFSDGVAARAEAKCKLEDSQISRRSIEKSLSQAKSQMPERIPGIIFVKVPRPWFDDPKLVEVIDGLAENVLKRSPSIVSIKYFAAEIRMRNMNQADETITEVLAFREHTNENHRFRKLRGRNWDLFEGRPNAAIPNRNATELPSTWRQFKVGAIE